MIQETFSKRDMPRITAIIAGFFGSCADDKEYTLEIKEKKKKRSLDANALYWEYVHDIAYEAQVEVTTVYREHIKQIGGNNDIVCVQNQAVDKFCEVFESRGLGWCTERMPSKIAGCTNVICYYGSSTYDSKQMHRLIQLAEQDCREYGIPTVDEIRLQQMLDAWGGDTDGHSRAY